MKPVLPSVPQHTISESDRRKWEVAQLRAQLAQTDWIVAKCYDEQVPTREKYPTLHAQRAALRERINELERQDA